MAGASPVVVDLEDEPEPPQPRLVPDIEPLDSDPVAILRRAFPATPVAKLRIVARAVMEGWTYTRASTSGVRAPTMSRARRLLGLR